MEPGEERGRVGRGRREQLVERRIVFLRALIEPGVQADLDAGPAHARVDHADELLYLVLGEHPSVPYSSPSTTRGFSRPVHGALKPAFSSSHKVATSAASSE